MFLYTYSVPLSDTRYDPIEGNKNAENIRIKTPHAWHGTTREVSEIEAVAKPTSHQAELSKPKLSTNWAVNSLIKLINQCLGIAVYKVQGITTSIFGVVFCIPQAGWLPQWPGWRRATAGAPGGGSRAGPSLKSWGDLVSIESGGVPRLPCYR